MKQKMLDRYRERALDYFVVLCSVVCILGGLVMMAYCSIILNISEPSPYLMYLVLVYLGLSGLRYYKKEVEL